MDVDAAAAMIKALEEAAKSTERPDSLGRLTITITPPGPVDGDLAKRFEDVGVDRLVTMRGFGDMAAAKGPEVDDAIVKFLEDQARSVGIG